MPRLKMDRATRRFRENVRTSHRPANASFSMESNGPSLFRPPLWIFTANFHEIMIRPCALHLSAGRVCLPNNLDPGQTYAGTRICANIPRPFAPVKRADTCAPDGFWKPSGGKLHAGNPAGILTDILWLLSSGLLFARSRRAPISQKCHQKTPAFENRHWGAARPLHFSPKRNPSAFEACDRPNTILSRNRNFGWFD